MTEATTGEQFVFDPFQPGFTDDPYPHYAELRERAPVHRHPFGFWVLSRYADMFALLRAGLSVDLRHVSPDTLPDGRDSVTGAVEPVSGLSMLDVDPPDHTRLRRLVSKAFTPRAVAALEPEIEDLVDGALREIAGAGRVDLVEALSFPLPFTVISRMLGMPSTDHERLRELSGTLVRSLEPIVDTELARAVEAADAEIAAMTAEAIAWKRRHPADDLLTALIAAEDGGDVLSDDELVAQVVLLYLAGHETTVNLISGGVLALLRAPDQLALLRREPELAGNAVEELLRYDSPVQSSRRITLRPYEVDGREIPAGSFVMASLASANRDEAFWGPDAERPRLDREGARQHLSFGGGPHHCLGASLARLEGRVAIGRLVERFPRLELDGEVEWNGRINLRGPERLPIRV
ncbi:Cytochrome P450 [Amycolatopsis arida]|uniref:Cytochrome P450 n=1 Tax=Amycolatopsis arida TaxID=587909 RepID=A0A1I5WFG6_9PSEU|nr:cytochrome P450 [Amycolatopsis arida]TDX92257.1 cytochrome P450 [Amycolatopsis arida]SFQ18472.1 Cytochrome P450 [Amycolatopsis arida]